MAKTLYFSMRCLGAHGSYEFYSKSSGFGRLGRNFPTFSPPLKNGGGGKTANPPPFWKKNPPGRGLDNLKAQGARCWIWMGFLVFKA